MYMACSQGFIDNWCRKRLQIRVNLYRMLASRLLLYIIERSFFEDMLINPEIFLPEALRKLFEFATDLVLNPSRIQAISQLPRFYQDFATSSGKSDKSLTDPVQNHD
jgi:hypothetical protein